MEPTKALTQDPCPFGLPEILTVAHTTVISTVNTCPFWPQNTELNTPLKEPQLPPKEPFKVSEPLESVLIMWHSRLEPVPRHNWALERGEPPSHVGSSRFFAANPSKLLERVSRG